MVVFNVFLLPGLYRRVGTGGFVRVLYGVTHIIDIYYKGDLKYWIT